MVVPVPPDRVIDLDDALIARARRGDAAAFRRIFDRHAPAVRAFLRNLFGDRDAADEATQETFVRAFQKLDTLREGAKIGSWLFGIARNVFREAVRARRRIDRPRAGEKPVLEDSARAPPDPAPSPEQLAVGHEAQQAISAALEELSEHRRAALLLRIDHGLAYEEIGEILGWPLHKVKNEIHRGRRQLRQKLARWRHPSE